MDKLKDKVAIVTGASKGIGAASWLKAKVRQDGQFLVGGIGETTVHARRLFIGEIVDGHLLSWDGGAPCRTAARRRSSQARAPAADFAV